MEKSLAVTGFTAKGFARDLGLDSIRPNLTSDLDVMKAFSILPTFEVHGIAGGYTGPGQRPSSPTGPRPRSPCASSRARTRSASPASSGSS